MKLFPAKQLQFKLVDSHSETLDRLTRRTQKSTRLISQSTDKSFIGIIDDKRFRIISSVVGKGAFCVMTGTVEQGAGVVNVEIHKPFRVLLSVLLVLPIIGFFVTLLTRKEEFSPIFILVAIGQVLMIRYFFIGMAFKYLAKENLNRLRDVLDVEWVRN